MRIPFIPNTVILLLALLSLEYLYVLRTGYISPSYSPLPAISLDERNGWFVDWRLAALAGDRELCQRVLVPPHAVASAVQDQAYDAQGCGWANAVSLQSAGGATIGLSPVTCQAAAAYSLWMIEVVQPEAERLLGSRVTAVSDFGTYSCRNIIGGFYQKYRKLIERVSKDIVRSQHATANAIDISGFTLASGERIVVARDWKGGGPKAAFLRAVHEGACRYFRVVLGPEANREHHDHLHMDRGFLRACR